MKYTVEVTINKNVEEVIKLFDSTENMYKWMQGLQSFEHISGTPGEVGAKSKLKFKMGKREIEMVETITEKNLPQSFSGTYDAGPVFNIIKNKFIPIDKNTTRYVAEQEFKFKNLMMKLMGLLNPGAFKIESMKNMHAFKNFAEQQ